MPKTLNEILNRINTIEISESQLTDEQLKQEWGKIKKDIEDILINETRIKLSELEQKKLQALLSSI